MRNPNMRTRNAGAPYVGTQWVAMVGSALVGLLALSGPALSQQKTVKVCQEEWRANKDANQAAGVTEKAYVDKCRAGAAATPAAATPGAAPPPPAPPPSPATVQKPAKPAATPVSAPAKPAPTAPTGANQFAAEALAKAHCPVDTVVWANLDSKVYHFAGNKNYGTTKDGAYMCEKDAMGQGGRAAKNEKHP
jgi:type IV secretory pathway VirB10-like protein